MTEDEILAEAARIKHRRLQEARYAAFKDKETVMVRFSNSIRSGMPESYTSFDVPVDAIDDAAVRKALGLPTT